MLRILNHIPKHLRAPAPLPTPRHPIRHFDLRRDGLDARGRERAPGVEFAVGPVCVGGADGPAAEVGVCLRDGGPGGEEVARGGGELAVADFFPVGEGVVL